MAMISCPECGQEISDKAVKCIHCGTFLVEESVTDEEIKCSECRTILSETDQLCPNCGCPVEKKLIADQTMLQQTEESERKKTRKIKGMMIGIVAVVIFCAGGGIGYKVYTDKKEEQEYIESYNRYIKSYNKYIENLEQIQLLMLVGASKAESLCNLTGKVWSNTIYKDSDSETDKYTRPNGYFVSDFNVALTNLYLDSDTTKTISDIKSNQKSVKELMKKIQNPPKGLDKCYDTVSDLYDGYKKLTDLAINPSGSLMDFGKDKKDAVSDFMESIEKLDNQVPKKRQKNKGVLINSAYDC